MNQARGRGVTQKVMFNDKGEGEAQKKKNFFDIGERGEPKIPQIYMTSLKDRPLPAVTPLPCNIHKFIILSFFISILY